MFSSRDRATFAALCAILLVAATCLSARGQEGAKAANPVGRPSDAFRWAAADCARIPEAARHGVRYAWDPSGDLRSGQMLTAVLNMSVSQANSSVQAALVPESNGQLWRFDLRVCCPNEDDYARVWGVLESLDVIEPYFHVVQDVIDPNAKSVRVAVKPYKASDGKTYDYKYEKRTTKQAAILAAHCGEDAGTLSQMTSSNNPLMRLDWLSAKCLTTLDGGVYYKLLNVGDTKTINGKKVTAQAQWLAWLGADESLVAKLGSDDRALVLRSGVAGRRPRLVTMFFGVAARPAAGVPLISLSHDVFPEDVDPRIHPLRNLTGFYDVSTGSFKDRAREAIGVRQNGWPTYALFNQDGSLQEVVPDKIARDDVPFPFDSRLQPGLSCIRCHFPHDNWQPLRNDVHRLLAGSPGEPRLSVYDDLASKNSPQEALARLASQFSATEFQLNRALQISRDSIADTAYRSTKYSHLRIEGASLPVLGELIRASYAGLMFEPVTPQKALLEMGYRVSAAEAPALFNELCPPLPLNQYGFSPEDPLVGALRAWTPEHPLNLSRFEWEQIYADVMLRAAATEATRQ